MREPEATEWDWEAIRRRCRTEALRILRSREDADDVVQEALIRAWSHRAECRSRESPLGWCLQITRNEALRVVSQRRTRLQRQSLAEEDPAELVDERSLRATDMALTRIAVIDALEQLSAHERVLMSLRYDHDRTHPQIAAALGMPEATVRVHLHRAHNRLRRTFRHETWVND
jgi:RNA polymerase sigma-70 factor, ECF subfamily